MSQDTPDGRAAVDAFLAGANPFKSRPADVASPPATPRRMDVPTDIPPQKPSVVEAIDQAISATKAQIDTTQRAAELWAENLKRVGLTPEQAYAALDNVLLMGDVYEEEVQLWPRISCRFRMRPAQATFSLAAALEERKPWAATTFNLIAADNNLCFSLLQYGKKSFDPESPEGRNAIYDFLRKLPDPVYHRLSAELGKFDERVAVIFDAGSVRDF